MWQSHVITIDTDFVGVAIRVDHGYRFVATDCRLYELDETIWPTLADVGRLARRLYHTGSFFKDSAEEPTIAAMQVGG
jgi:hypothetical protein